MKNNKPNLFLAIKLSIQGLKCDAPNCGYVDDQVTLTKSVIAENINRPCPKCAANLLTAADAKTTRVMIDVCHAINIIAFPFMVLTLPVRISLWIVFRRPQTNIFRADMDGSGSVNIKQP